MTDIYDHHAKAFNRVSAYVILKNGERVATIAFKFPADGAGRLYAYVHWLGVPMVRGFAGGYGYDKRAAALANAVRKMPETPQQFGPEQEQVASTDFYTALEHDRGPPWGNALRDAGFTVLQAV